MESNYTQKRRTTLPRFFFTDGFASSNPFYGPFNDKTEAETAYTALKLMDDDGTPTAADGTLMSIKDPNTKHTSLYTRNRDITEGAMSGWEEVGKDIASYITFNDTEAYDILTVVNPDTNVAVRYQLQKEDTILSTTYSDITITNFSYNYIDFNGGTAYPTISFTQTAVEDHSVKDDVQKDVSSDCAITYDIVYTNNANTSVAGTTVEGATSGNISRTGANSYSGGRCKIADVTVTVSGHGKTATKTASVYQDVVSDKIYTVASSTLSYPTATNAGTEDLKPTLSIVVNETVTYTESTTPTITPRTYTSFYSTEYSTVSSLSVNASNGIISAVGKGTFRLVSEAATKTTTLGTVNVTAKVIDARDVNNNILSTSASYTVLQATRYPEVTNYNYKVVITEYTYDGEINGNGGSVSVSSLKYKIMHKPVLEDTTYTGNTYSDYLTDLSVSTADANRTVTYSTYGTAVSGVSINASTGVVTKSTVGSVLSTTNAGQFQVSISTKLNDEKTGNSTDATTEITAKATVLQAIRELSAYYGVSDALYTSNDTLDTTQYSHVIDEASETFSWNESLSKKNVWFAVPDGYSISIIDAFGDVTDDYEDNAVTISGFTIYQYQFTTLPDIQYTIKLAQN